MTLEEIQETAEEIENDLLGRDYTKADIISLMNAPYVDLQPLDYAAFGYLLGQAER